MTLYAVLIVSIDNLSLIINWDEWIVGLLVKLQKQIATLGQNKFVFCEGACIILCDRGYKFLDNW